MPRRINPKRLGSKALWELEKKFDRKYQAMKTEALLRTVERLAKAAGEMQAGKGKKKKEKKKGDKKKPHGMPRVPTRDANLTQMSALLRAIDRVQGTLPLEKQRALLPQKIVIHREFQRQMLAREKAIKKAAEGAKRGA